MYVIVSQEGFSCQIHSVQKYPDGVREPFYKKVACLHDVIFILQTLIWCFLLFLNVIG